MDVFVHRNGGIGILAKATAKRAVPVIILTGIESGIVEVPLESCALHFLCPVTTRRTTFPGLDNLFIFGLTTATLVRCGKVDCSVHLGAADGERAGCVALSAVIGHGNRCSVVGIGCSDACRGYREAVAADADGQGLGQVSALNGDGLAHAFARVGTHVNGRAIGRRRQHRCRGSTGIPHTTLLVSPDVFYQLRIVDKGVTVLLDTIYRIVAPGFKRAHGIIAVPLQQLVDGPISQSQIGAGSEHDIAGTAGIVAHTRHVACREIEINTREVALVLVGDLKHSAVISAKGACAQFAGTLGHAVGTVAKRMIAAFVVHPSVNREHVMQVGVGSITIAPTPPAVGNRVLTVVAVSNAAVITALVAAIGVLCRGIAVDNGCAVAVC